MKVVDPRKAYKAAFEGSIKREDTSSLDEFAVQNEAMVATLLAGMLANPNINPTELGQVMMMGLVDNAVRLAVTIKVYGWPK